MFCYYYLLFFLLFFIKKKKSRNTILKRLLSFEGWENFYFHFYPSFLNAYLRISKKSGMSVTQISSIFSYYYYNPKISYYIMRSNSQTWWWCRSSRRNRYFPNSIGPPSSWRAWPRSFPCCYWSTPSCWPRASPFGRRRRCIRSPDRFPRAVTRSAGKSESKRGGGFYLFVRWWFDRDGADIRRIFGVELMYFYFADQAAMRNQKRK